MLVTWSTYENNRGKISLCLSHSVKGFQCVELSPSQPWSWIHEWPVGSDGECLPQCCPTVGILRHKRSPYRSRERLYPETKMKKRQDGQGGNRTDRLESPWNRVSDNVVSPHAVKTSKGLWRRVWRDSVDVQPVEVRVGRPVYTQNSVSSTVALIWPQTRNGKENDRHTRNCRFPKSKKLEVKGVDSFPLLLRTEKTINLLQRIL